MSWRMQEIVEPHPIAPASLGPHWTTKPKEEEEGAEDSSASKPRRPQGTAHPVWRESALQARAEGPRVPAAPLSYCRCCCCSCLHSKSSLSSSMWAIAAAAAQAAAGVEAT
jgi:hypothetical protein